MGQSLEDDLNECLRSHVAPYLSQSDRRICCICSPERAVPACLASSPPHKKNGLRGDGAQCAQCVRAVCTVRACILRVLEESFGFLNPFLKPFPISLHFKVVQGHLAGVVHGIISDCLDTNPPCAPKPPQHAQSMHRARTTHACPTSAACVQRAQCVRAVCTVQNAMPKARAKAHSVKKT